MIKRRFYKQAHGDGDASSASSSSADDDSDSTPGLEVEEEEEEDEEEEEGEEIGGAKDDNEPISPSSGSFCCRFRPLGDPCCIFSY